MTTGLSQITNTLEYLLLPPENMWSDVAAQFEDVWADSPLADWSDALQGQPPAVGPAGECQGPGVGPLTLIDDAPGSYGEVEIPELYPFSTCSPEAAQAASMVRMALTASIALAGAWRMWDMLAGSFGAYRGGGRHMSESDWL